MWKPGWPAPVGLGEILDVFHQKHGICSLYARYLGRAGITPEHFVKDKPYLGCILAKTKRTIMKTQQSCNFTGATVHVQHLGNSLGPSLFVVAC